MIETFTLNNKTYTKRENLHPWEFNLRIINDVNFEKLGKARRDYIAIESLLVMPDGLILGGNNRWRSDTVDEVENEEIRLIDFQKGEDGRWYVLEDAQTLRTDKKSFSTLEAAMRAYSLLHNAQYAGTDPDELANIIGMQEYDEMDWSEFLTVIGEPISIEAYINKVAPGALKDLENLGEENTPESTDNVEVAAQSQSDKEKDAVQPAEGHNVTCPACSHVFVCHG